MVSVKRVASFLCAASVVMAIAIPIQRDGQDDLESIQFEEVEEVKEQVSTSLSSAFGSTSILPSATAAVVVEGVTPKGKPLNAGRHF
ncbi:hypothetical protein BDR26DRAFT_874546 [Obelidium mucronatum]|nr:hypothetical protein BDR26DRAFT_874546 [Obelidium mucronatum]